MKILETERLILRQFKPRDFSDFADLGANAKAMFWLCDGKTLSPQEVENWLNQSFDNYEKLGYGIYAVELKATQKFIGFGGFFVPEADNHPELVIALDDQYWNQGLGKEAGKALIDYACKTLKFEMLRAGADQGNIYSLRMIRSLGFKFEKTALSPANLPVDYFYLNLD